MSAQDLRLDRTSFGDPADRGHLMNIEAATALLNEWVDNERLRLHMRQVAGLMKAWALEKEGATPEVALKWELAGLLHDADWEKYPTAHCRVIIEKLEELHCDPDVIRCIACHGPKYFGVEPETKMEKMIYAFDELSGFVHASALVRPTRYEGMDVKGILKKLKTASFAAQVSREDIADATSRIDLSLEDLIAFIIEKQQHLQ